MPFKDVTSKSPVYPARDGEILRFIKDEARAQRYFDDQRLVVFINGMNNTGQDHFQSAMMLSLLQMAPVIGVYNLHVSGWQDFKQCIADKNQFNGLSMSAENKVAWEQFRTNVMSGGRGGFGAADAARAALSRNPAAVAMFDLLRSLSGRRIDIFAHSQGNLILSNALQAIVAVDGSSALGRLVVHSYGSPAVNWPANLTRSEQAFTFDPVTWLSGFDTSFSVSKLGMPQGALNPISHGFEVYMANDPAFVVNRFRTGGWGMTFNMDEDGLAKCLAEMGSNMPRVHAVFSWLDRKHNVDADDVALAYVNRIKTRSTTTQAMAGARGSSNDLRALLIRILEEGWTTSDERKAIAWLRTVGTPGASRAF